MCFHPKAKKTKNENLTFSDIHVLKTTWANALSLECEEVISRSFEHLLQFLVVKMAKSWLKKYDSTTIGDESLPISMFFMPPLLGRTLSLSTSPPPPLHCFSLIFEIVFMVVHNVYIVIT
jgi:hypothetical protein